jgi:hypothetical protein
VRDVGHPDVRDDRSALKAQVAKLAGLHGRGLGYCRRGAQGGREGQGQARRGLSQPQAVLRSETLEIAFVNLYPDAAGSITRSSPLSSSPD